MRTLTIARPLDAHLHLRDGAAMAMVLPDTAQRFAAAIVMPNLKPPVTTVAAAAAYRERILAALPKGLRFEPLMTLYLTDDTTAAEIHAARASDFVHAIKYYPAGATTNSAAGVTDIQRCRQALAAMEASGLPLLVHGELTDVAVDVFDREAAFIERVALPLRRDFPGLRLVFEHITTGDAVDFVRGAGPGVAATITAHHLLLNRNAIFAGGLRPHNYCLPLLKREAHRRALVAAAVSGDPKFFLGSDSAPHGRSAKEADHGCAGCYTAHAGIELYAQLFDAEGALTRLEGFASHYGADFYGLSRSRETLTLVSEAWTVPVAQAFADGEALVPFMAGETILWRVQP